MRPSAALPRSAALSGPALAAILAAAVSAIAIQAGAAPAVGHTVGHTVSHHVDRSKRPETGRASYYARSDAGRTTASGAPYVPGKLTAASPKLPLGTKAKVTNLDNGKSVNVTVTDRGPYVKKRILDVSSKAATKLGLKKDGVAEVKVRPLSEPPAPRQGG
ncbi:MAG TPA: septal ring lytic transglycosylase RlpA family protein [Caulobacteraceae bacterium]|jgi:rare lipoprotein A